MPELPKISLISHPSKVILKIILNRLKPQAEKIIGEEQAGFRGLTGLTCDQGSAPVLWTYMGRKTLPPSTSLPVMGEIAGVNTASLGRYLHSTKTRARWAEGFHELNGHVFDLERHGLRQVVFCLRLTMR